MYKRQKLYKKELIREQFPVDLNLGEDLLFNEAYIRQAARISVLQQPVCEYIQDDRGTTLSTKKRNDKVETALLLYEKTKAFFQSCYPDVGQFAFLADKPPILLASGVLGGAFAIYLVCSLADVLRAGLFRLFRVKAFSRWAEEAVSAQLRPQLEKE